MAVSYKFYHGAAQPEDFAVGGIWFDSAAHCINVKVDENQVETYGGVVNAELTDDAKGIKITKADGSSVIFAVADYEAGDGIAISGQNVEVSYDDTLKIDDDKKLSVKNALSDEEKKWIADQLFAKLFVATISANPSSTVFSGSSVDVTFTLTTKYSGNLVDLEEVPSGWTKTGDGTYTKAGQITADTKGSISSGNVSCKYLGNTKTASSTNAYNTKYSFFIESTAESLTAADLNAIVDSTASKISDSNNIAGDKKYTMKAKGYLYFVIANTSSLSDVQAMNVSMLQSKTPTELVRTNYGTYKVYRSAAELGAQEQSFTIK